MSYIGRSPQIGGYHKLDAITTDGSASYTMQLDSANFTPESANHLIVSVNGVIQAPTDSFTVSGSTITFASSLSSSDTIDFIMALGNTLDIGVPSDGTISASKLATTSITGQTAETSANDSDSLLIYDDSATALRKMTRGNFLSGVGGTNTPYFHVYLGSDQSVSSGATHKVQFDTELYDSNSDYDNTTNYRYTPTVAGKYVFYTGVVYFADGSGMNFNKVSIRLNGSIIASAEADERSNPARQMTAFAQVIQDMNGSTDYVEVYSFVQSTTGSSHFESEGRMTYFGGYKIIE